MDEPHARNLRKGRYSEPNRIYHIVMTTRKRHPIFADLYAARVVVKALKYAQESGCAQTLAFVVMPDHCHWLVQLMAGSLAEVVGAVKSVAAHHLGGRIWQAGYFDHALRGEEDMRAVARYIVANPLRAGLVERIGDYPHWDAIWL